MSWYVYMLRCADDSLYTGITTDLRRRVDEHNSNAKGARYTRSRAPVSLAYSEPAPDRSAASRREWQIKQLSRRDKLALVELQAKTGRPE